MRHPIFAALALALAACAPADDSAPLGDAASAIVNGSADNTHQAVVAYLHGSKCSATIVHVSGTTGYALTAAHCIDGNLGVLRQGNNHANGEFDEEYTVTAAEVHPEYNSANLYDLAMLRFSGATGATPVIPPLSKAQDNIGVGTQIDLVGYGLTESGSTTERMHKTLPVDLETALRLRFDQTTGGICSGDSGGAALHDTGGTEYVAAVHSFISGDCTTAGTSIRVSAAHDTFIMPYINGTPYLEHSCDECTDAHTFGGACNANVVACFDDTACSAYIDCRRTCTSQSCLVGCGNDHPAGKLVYDEIYTCVCENPCASECADDALCNPPLCGLVSTDTSCQTCFEGSCCAETQACADDPTCLDCASGDLFPACNSNATFAAWNTCRATHCADACDLPPGEGGGGAGGTSSMGEGGMMTGGTGGATTTGTGAEPADDLALDQGCACSTAPAPQHHAWLALLLPFAAWVRRRV